VQCDAAGSTPTRRILQERVSAILRFTGITILAVSIDRDAF
jgi:hypothetical protein